jgi:CheY-like chemotaxis protein
VIPPLILVVDDDPEVRPLAATILRNAGFAVLEADGGDQALGLLDRHRDVALIVTDIVMPGIDGFVLADRAKALRPDLRVVYTTGYSEALGASRAAAHGAVLPKPYHPRQLEAVVRAALA